ncbi:MAG: hypothetical protein HYR84_03200 [Planctomycetes bacterium]|nr:hypothetical protein [Planctomycetota bacterium]
MTRPLTGLGSPDRIANPTGRRMLDWKQTEFLLKGIYFGFLVMIAWFVPQWDELALITLYTLGGLGLCLGWAAYQKIREGYRIQGRLLGFIVFLLLDHPGLVYAGLLGGLSIGTILTFHSRVLVEGQDAIPIESVWPVAGGAILGYIFFAMRHVEDTLQRFWISLAMIAVLVGGAAAFYYLKPDVLRQDQQLMIAVLLLVGIPGFYLLTFSGLVEESEIEIAAMCAALGVAMWTFLKALSPAVGGAVVLLPLGIYFVYSTKFMPAIRVFKHSLRGMSYRQMGQTKMALIHLSRALQLDPENELAREQMWMLHRDLDFNELHAQPDLVQFLHFDFCMERISQMLQTKPTEEQLRESFKMLDLVTKEQPALAPICAYWRAVAFLHQKNDEDAARELESILKLPQYQTQARQAVHYSAWYLAMFGHPDMKWRVADRLLYQPGHRMDAIAAVEAQLDITPLDTEAWRMKKQLYDEINEGEYYSMVQPDQPMPRFHHEYAKELGMGLLGDRMHWRRGCEYLRIAAHGLPMQAANLYIKIAQTNDIYGDTAGMWANYTKAMRLGRTLGTENMEAADKDALFASVKAIGELAMKQNQLDVALEAFKFYSQHESAGIETYRMLAELFERIAERSDRANNLWMALHCCEHALTYNATDPDLVGRKDRYYYSIAPEDLRGRLESVRKWFDVDYCREKANWILERFNGDFELLDWAAHLADLALVAQPGSHAARFIKARLHRLRGEIPETIGVLEEIRQHRPEKFANDEESKAWYFAHRMLGDLYLDEKPGDAVACYLEFRQSDEAGADTSFKLGKAYEALGDFPKAAVCYDEVTAYEMHPLYHEACDALQRLKRGGGAAARQAGGAV